MKFQRAFFSVTLLLIIQHVSASMISSANPQLTLQPNQPTQSIPPTQPVSIQLQAPMNQLNGYHGLQFFGGQYGIPNSQQQLLSSRSPSQQLSNNQPLNQQPFTQQIQTLPQQQRQDPSITQLEKSVACLKQEIQNQKETIQKIQNGHNEMISAFQELKTLVVAQSNKILDLENENKKLILSSENCCNDNSNKIDNLTVQLAELGKIVKQLNEQSKPKPQPPVTPVQSFLPDSKIVTTNQEGQIMRGFFNRRVKSTRLLYRASENGFSVKKFHQKCDGIQNTLTLVWTGTDKKVGGYTPLAWSSSVHLSVADNSRESFLFSLTNNDKFGLVKPEFGVFQHFTAGPTFGGASDLHISDNAATILNSYANIGHSYINSKYTFGQPSSWERFTGSSNNTAFYTREWEVWAVEFA